MPPTLPSLGHDLLGKIVEAFAHPSLPWRALTRDAYALSCTCKELRAALEAWASPIAAEMMRALATRPTLRTSAWPIPRPLHLVCTEAKAMRGTLDVPYSWFNPGPDLDSYNPDRYDGESRADSLVHQSVAFECCGRPWRDRGGGNWVVSMRRQYREVRVWNVPLRASTPESVVYVRVAVLNAAGEEVRALRLEAYVPPRIAPGEERLLKLLVVGRCLHTKARRPKKPRPLTPLEVAEYRLCRPDGTVRLEFYASEMDDARERLEK